MSDDLSCPACDEEGGSPIGVISWVCENPECGVETFRLVDYDDPNQIGEDN